MPRGMCGDELDELFDSPQELKSAKTFVRKIRRKPCTFLSLERAIDLVQSRKNIPDEALEAEDEVRPRTIVRANVEEWLANDEFPINNRTRNGQEEVYVSDYECAKAFADGTGIWDI